MICGRFSMCYSLTLSTRRFSRQVNVLKWMEMLINFKRLPAAKHLAHLPLDIESAGTAVSLIKVPRKTEMENSMKVLLELWSTLGLSVCGNVKKARLGKEKLNCDAVEK